MFPLRTDNIWCPMIPPIGPHVYFVEAENGLIKIGYSANVALRFRALLTTSAAPLKLLGWIPGTTATERDLHDKLEASRSHGEWFRPTPEMAAVLGTIERPAEPSTKTAGRRGAALMAYLERMKRGEVVRPTRGPLRRRKPPQRGAEPAPAPPKMIPQRLYGPVEADGYRPWLPFRVPENEVRHIKKDPDHG